VIQSPLLIRRRYCYGDKGGASDTASPGFDGQFTEHYMADGFALFLGHQGSDHEPVRPEAVHDAGFILATEGREIQGCNGSTIGGDLGTYDGHRPRIAM